MRPRPRAAIASTSMELLAMMRSLLFGKAIGQPEPTDCRREQASSRPGRGLDPTTLQADKKRGPLTCVRAVPRSDRRYVGDGVVAALSPRLPPSAHVDSRVRSSSCPLIQLKQ